MDDLVTLLLIAIISVGVGIAVGSLISNAVNARQKNTRTVDDKAAGLIETIRVYRDLKTRNVVLAMRGKQYHKPGELDAAARAYLEQQLSALADWSTPASASKPAEVAASEPEQHVRLTAQAPVKESGPAGSPEPVHGSPTPDDGPKQSYNPLDVFARALRTDTHKTTFPSSSIAAQIDEILQEKLAGLPEEKRAIRLMELPGKGMVVMIGLDHFDGVDAVPDPEVQALIRECVGEWENRMDRQV